MFIYTLCGVESFLSKDYTYTPTHRKKLEGKYENECCFIMDLLMLDEFSQKQNQINIICNALLFEGIFCVCKFANGTS